MDRLYVRGVFQNPVESGVAVPGWAREDKVDAAAA